MLGCNIVDNCLVFALEADMAKSVQNLRPMMPSKFWSYVYSVDSVSEIVDVFGMLIRTNCVSESVWLQKFDSATAVQRDEMRNFIANGCGAVRFSGILKFLFLFL